MLLSLCGAQSAGSPLKTLRSLAASALPVLENSARNPDFRPLKIGLVVKCDSWYESSRIKSFNFSCFTGSERQAHHDRAENIEIRATDYPVPVQALGRAAGDETIRA